MFAIVDVETTGGYADNHRVIEVGIAISDGEQIIERYNQLIHPERNIPYHITQLTGISEDDVKDAPTFGEVASKIYDLLHGQIFVAHNVNFDYTFIKRELEEAGYTWQAKKLCTVRSTRKIVPGLKKYSLSALAEHFDIVNPNPHRALADAETAAEILHLLRGINAIEIDKAIGQRAATSQLPIHLDPKVFHALPERPGVYYMKGEQGQMLYIGKAINIKQRISQHFTGSSGAKRRQRWLREIHHIDYRETGSEALALLHEDHEIRHHWPPYNAAQKHPVAKWGVVHYVDRKNIPRLAVQRAEKRVDVLEHFYSYTAAQQFLGEVVREYALHPQLSGLGWDADVTVDDHKEHFQFWMEQRKGEKRSGYILFSGIQPNEKGFVRILEGRYAGIGVLSQNEDWQDAKNKLWHHHDSPTAQQIVTALLRENELIDGDISI